MGTRMEEKLTWHGVVRAVQPRIRLLRSFDERQHSYLGFALLLRGTIADRGEDDFSVGIGKAAQAKHRLRAGDEVRGQSALVRDGRMEPVEYYRTSAIRVVSSSEMGTSDAPPWRGFAPELSVYRDRRCRRLDPRTYGGPCVGCIWGCRMPVEMILDHWNPTKRRYRFETFCYGPKACSLYRAGTPRKVPGRNGMVYVEEDWVDEQETAHRAPDE